MILISSFARTFYLVLSLGFVDCQLLDSFILEIGVRDLIVILLEPIEIGLYFSYRNWN
jgi:hypothetical protein